MHLSTNNKLKLICYFRFLLYFRGVVCVDGVSGVSIEEGDLNSSPVRFRHDPRMVLSSRAYLTNDQVKWLT